MFRDRKQIMDSLRPRLVRRAVCKEMEETFWVDGKVLSIDNGNCSIFIFQNSLNCIHVDCRNFITWKHTLISYWKTVDFGVPTLEFTFMQISASMQISLWNPYSIYKLQVIIFTSLFWGRKNWSHARENALCKLFYQCQRRTSYPLELHSKTFCNVCTCKGFEVMMQLQTHSTFSPLAFVLHGPRSRLTFPLFCRLLWEGLHIQTIVVNFSFS